MRFQLLEVLLWSRPPNVRLRRVTFNPVAVNIIGGASRTGKSALIPIIDYCLGADKCTIPSGVIREACEWFGVLVDTDQGQKLFARREPGDQRSTSDMFMLEGARVFPPERIESRNTNVESVKKNLDQLSGLSALDFQPEDGGFIGGRPSFRDVVSFMFQPQNIVANQNVLFYKADSYEHREKLRTIFPYLLGAVSPEILAKRHELSQLRRELKRKEQELKSVREVSQRWAAEISSKVTRAVELGLVGLSDAKPANVQASLELLRGVASRTRIETGASEQSITQSMSELAALQKEEREISQELSKLRRRFAEMSELKESAGAFQGALQTQRDRLEVSRWLKRLNQDTASCPICLNKLDSRKEIDQLVTSLEQVEQTAVAFQGIPATFDREFERVRFEISRMSERLRGVRIRVSDLEQRSEQFRAEQYSLIEAARFVGTLESDLRTYDRLGTDSELERETSAIRDRVRSLESEISEQAIGLRTDRALAAVNLNAGRLIPRLDTERPSDPVALSIRELSVKIEGLQREDFLYEIGSGSNWLSYHVAFLLALQQFFLGLPRSPVPALLVFDQPSQVYFPKRLAEKGEEEAEPTFRDEDVQAVQKVIQVMSDVVSESQNTLQIIVLDHAAENVWGRVPMARLVEDWREGRKLIPPEWLVVGG